MKFDPTPTQLVLLALLLAAIIAAPLFSPASVPSVSMLVSTIVGSLFINLKTGPVFTVARGGLIPAPSDDGLVIASKENPK